LHILLQGSLPNARQKATITPFSVIKINKKTLQLLLDRNCQPEVIEYLKTPLSISELKLIIEQLGFQSARQLMRTKEPEYKALGLDNLDLSEISLMEAMLSSPKLIERPIVINNDVARIGRPPEAVVDIL
jgi:arsenate reductase